MGGNSLQKKSINMGIVASLEISNIYGFHFSRFLWNIEVLSNGDILRIISLNDIFIYKRLVQSWDGTLNLLFFFYIIKTHEELCHKAGIFLTNQSKGLNFYAVMNHLNIARLLINKDVLKKTTCVLRAYPRYVSKIYTNSVIS